MNRLDLYYDVVIAGCGVAGLYTALHLPRDKRILMISKAVSYTHLTLPTSLIV